MIRFAADEDFNNDVVRALRRSLPDVADLARSHRMPARASVRARGL